MVSENEMRGIWIVTHRPPSLIYMQATYQKYIFSYE